MIQLQNVVLGYPNNKNILTLSHCFPTGKISVIVGENGVGKSTLIKALTNQLIPRSGVITLYNKNLNHYSIQEFAKQIAYLPQNPTAPTDITVHQLCLASRFPYKKKWRGYTDEDKKIVGEMIDLVGLTSYKNTPLGFLSGGLLQRAWFAMILAQQTDILILDEPTSFLDIAYQLELLELLQHLNQTFKKTIIMILHDINHAIRYADEIIALRKDNSPLITTPQIIQSTFFEQSLHIHSHITKDPLYDKPYAIPLHNTFKKAPQ
ncbi:MAG: ABC transporter ATP-binding protein [Culicoidibacterales bacterium]